MGCYRLYLIDLSHVQVEVLMQLDVHPRLPPPLNVGHQGEPLVCAVDALTVQTAVVWCNASTEVSMKFH
jgi:hypothetical protein